jgi:hypothetical protein
MASILSLFYMWLEISQRCLLPYFLGLHVQGEDVNGTLGSAEAAV